MHRVLKNKQPEVAAVPEWVAGRELVRMSDAPAAESNSAGALNPDLPRRASRSMPRYTDTDRAVSSAPESSRHPGILMQADLS